MHNRHWKRVIGLLVCLLLGANAVSYAQKSPVSKKALRSLRRQQLAGLITAEQVEQITRTSVSLKVTKEVARANANAQRFRHQARRAEQLSSFKRLPWPPEQKIRELVQTEKNIFSALNKTQAIQQTYGDHQLFEILARHYYKQNFGTITPHLQQFFMRIAQLNDPQLESRVLKRMRFLADNSQLLADQIAPQMPRHAIRLRYLANIEQLTAKRFNPNFLVLSVERKMSDKPEKDFPLRHVSGQSVLTVGNSEFAVFAYAGPLEYLGNLYRYLVNGKHSRAPMTMVLDEEHQALAVYNEDNSLWIRITSHEFSHPNQLHIHLNEIRPVLFQNAYGNESHELVNINLSIPLMTPDDLPSHGVSQFLFKHLLLNPVKHFQGDAHVTIERRSIF